MMIWLIVASVAMLLTGVLLYLNGKQRLAYGFVFGPIVLMLVLLALSHFSDGWSDDEVPVESLALRDANMSEAPGAGYRLTARVLNQSADQTIGSVAINIQALDCPVPTGPDCTVIGEAQQDIRIEIPPGQARDVAANVVFGRAHLQVKGQLGWVYRINSARAK